MHFSAVRLHEVSDYGESETAASGISAAGLFGSPEAVEYTGQILRLDAAAGVGDVELDAAFHPVAADYDGAVRRCVAYRVLQEVAQYLAQADGVAFDGEVVCEVAGQCDSACLRGCLMGVE